MLFNGTHITGEMGGTRFQQPDGLSCQGRVCSFVYMFNIK